ncbi:hypothetical protein [Rickettsia helvetica]|nr:hypothetical protein [Rickettsia helvetica]MCZ6884617.1 hypothetical protein [Rickettsia endosymbiont of Ixodes ricinus]
MPEVVKTVVGTAVSAIYHYPIAVMATFVTAAVVASPENAAEFAYHDAAGIFNAAAGVVEILFMITYPSYSEVTPVDLTGSMEIAWVDAVA